MHNNILGHVEHIITIGKYRYLVEEKRSFVNVRIFCGEIQQDRLIFPTIEHAMFYISMQKMVD